jgi:DNA-binding CsgD family transcriptional regulator
LDNWSTLDCDISRRAFDAVAAAQQANTLSELNGVVGRTFKDLGFDTFLGVNAVDASGRANVEVLFGQTPDAWFAHYQAHGFAKNDAIIHEMLGSTDPLFWSDLSQRRTITDVELRILNEAGEFGLTNGFMTPLHNLDGSISAVLLMGAGIDNRDPDVRAAAHLLSLYYGSIGRRLLAQSRKRETLARPLTPRQRECLLWVRLGKSSSDIGDLLGLSAETVNDHIAGACARLGVRTRVQAVAEAAVHGYIQL